jgi:hypothetical protein
MVPATWRDCGENDEAGYSCIHQLNTDVDRFAAVVVVLAAVAVLASQDVHLHPDESTGDNRGPCRYR